MIKFLSSDGSFARTSDTLRRRPSPGKCPNLVQNSGWGLFVRVCNGEELRDTLSSK